MNAPKPFTQMKQILRGAILSVLALSSACSLFQRVPHVVTSVPVSSIPGHSEVAIDTRIKEDLRLVPVEAYVRTYLKLFGGLAPLEVQKRARGGDGGALFDTWDEYLGALGFPDYRVDLPRGTQTNAIMIATFERIGTALCDRAVEHDLIGGKAGAKKLNPPKANERLIFAFDLPTKTMEGSDFAVRFDVLHRTFLGYPEKLAKGGRTAKFFALYRDTVARHEKTPTKFSAEQAAWATVCYGLVRHPEFHLY